MEFNRVKISDDALVSAFKLRSSNLQTRQLTEIVTDIIRRISQELVTVHREGAHHLITTMPITFAVNNMGNKDSQRCIWASVIDHLKEKHFRVWISPKKNICRIKITWISPEDEADIIQQVNLIAKHTHSF
jgi:hypothetical protein